MSNFKINNVLVSEVLSEVPVPSVTVDTLDLNTNNRIISPTTDITYVINKDNYSSLVINLPNSGNIGQQKTIVVNKGASAFSAQRNIILDYVNNWGIPNNTSFGTKGDIIILVASLDGWALISSQIK